MFGTPVKSRVRSWAASCIPKQETWSSSCVCEKPFPVVQSFPWGRIHPCVSVCSIPLCPPGRSPSLPFGDPRNPCLSPQVLSGCAIIVRGQPRGGPPPERQINLSNIRAGNLARRAAAGQPEAKDTPDEVGASGSAIPQGSWDHGLGCGGASRLVGRLCRPQHPPLGHCKRHCPLPDHPVGCRQLHQLT